ncbi:hypothetical protein BO94DRAFT_239338 [Aspergillus sclerotioniger CBS 115572]|uniref:Developmental and secondary metabolism regulator veA n=1 Tax=Aspergillus sclerotioniger CBS 115572 TaxID=1450535 RepID=A0A317VIR9_9EURO|nr:hypothetical protein BO94DRAFT_239338 [Aspergillus sclerotioniger CBS 115572]PWY73087.1 hypothetical protein BO94DRAFT_239338 [Aspergillus sclerotioniger CBS 115572]
MATRPPLSPPVNETEHTASRITRDGKKITYYLKITQQPERARACGAGAKSSADRRPVDPPPVVQLHIYESDPKDDRHRTDITFAYNANFFLFATLETARPMAQGRLAPTPTFPVLTGVPVAGVAYLDRPVPAGYFIFPDLSVRHEGVYRLSFHLYEETKDSKDADEGTPILSPVMKVNGSKPSAPRSFLNFRLEVVSVPFTVFSAKKFPGLTTSTSLSRVIAEQGCRVRIRRDVRMRRRGDKRSDDYDFDDDRSYPGPLPDHGSAHDAYPNPAERPRSTSIGSIGPASSYGGEDPRRLSATEYGFPNSQTYPRQVPPAAVPPPSSTPTPVAPIAPSSRSSSYTSHLSFGATRAQYSAPQLPGTPQSATTPTQVYSPHPSYSHTRNPSTSTEVESAPPGYPPSSRLPTERSEYPKLLPPIRTWHHSEPPTNRAVDPFVPRAQTPTNPAFSLPPITSIATEYPNNPSRPPVHIAPKLNNPPQPPNHIAPTAHNPPQPPSHIAPTPNLDRRRNFWETITAASSKRPHEDAFGHSERALYNGMRPDSDLHPNMNRRPSDVHRAAVLNNGEEMAYRRANGRMAIKISPVVP